MKRLEEESTNCGKSRTSLTDKLINGNSMAQKSPVDLLRCLRLCQEAWRPGSPWDKDGAHAALWGRPSGSFLVVPDSCSQRDLLCVSIDDQGKTVQDLPVLHTRSALQLQTSHLTFSSLLQLVTFYTLSRDILPVCLSLPSWVYGLTDKPDHLVLQLGPKAWLCPTPELLPDMTPGTPDNQDTIMCKIHLTSASGALCIINPLYLQEHGDDWLNYSGSLESPRSHHRRERRLSTARQWTGGALKKRSESVDETSNSFSNSGSGSSVQIPVSPVTTSQVVLRRSSTSSDPDPQWRVSADSIGSSIPQSPHRVSWVEDKVWMTPPLPSSLLNLPCLELDSLSISSIEEEHEPEPAVSPSQSQNSPRILLADKVKNRLSAVGQALGGIISPERRMSKRVQEISERKGSPFADALRKFLDQTLKMKPMNGVTSTDMLQEVRSLLTALKETLYDTVEIQSLIDSMGDVQDIELDALVELSLHKVTLKPLHSHLYSCIKLSHQDNGSLQRLLENQHTLAGRSLEELEGTSAAGVPDAAMLEKIQHRWSTMHQEYLPQKKVNTMLKVCKNIYHSMTSNAKSGLSNVCSFFPIVLAILLLFDTQLFLWFFFKLEELQGVVFGADDFLPCLTWVLLRSDVVTLQIDTDYMMELLDPSQLQGEGGYYLTTLYAALFYIASFRPRLAVRQLSAEAHKSLSQWHRRRTLHCNQSRRSRSRRTFKRSSRCEVVTEGTEMDSSNFQEEDKDQTAVDHVTETIDSMKDDVEASKN